MRCFLTLVGTPFTTSHIRHIQHMRCFHTLVGTPFTTSHIRLIKRLTCFLTLVGNLEVISIDEMFARRAVAAV